jgi:Protein of unknown function with HXXEE motif
MKMQIDPLTFQDSSIWLLAAALIIHTIAEAWLPEWEKVKPNWQSVVFNRLLFLDNLPIFVFAIAIAFAGWKLPIIGGILPAIGITHPLFDHVGLSIWSKKIRPGSWTGMLLLFPLSIWVYSIGYWQHSISLTDFLISGAVGLSISLWLLWITIEYLKLNGSFS